MTTDLHQRLFFVIGAPRSGTTLLMRMLNVHDDIYTRPEPHLLTPLAYLGLDGHVDKAPYDQLQSALSTKQFVADLPCGEADYRDALRAYCDVMYGRMLAPTGKRYFVDKTPAYGLILPFITKVYPDARYVVLTRHPFSIFSSFAQSFFDGDWEAAQHHNPLLERYVPALARFIREAPVPHVHVRYEDLVTDPETQLRAICAHAEMTYDPAMIEYGKVKLEVSGLGDPIGVDKDVRPNTASLEKWPLEVHNNPRRLAILREAMRHITDEDLAVFGHDRQSVWAPLHEVDAAAARQAQRVATKWDRYSVERRALVVLRRNIHRNLLGKLLRKVRFYCDVLLRETWADTIDRTKPLVEDDRGSHPAA